MTGALELFDINNSLNPVTAFCVAEHHGGLMNIGTPKITDVSTFFAVQKRYCRLQRV